MVEMEDIRGVRLRKFEFKKNCIRGKDAFSSHAFWTHGQTQPHTQTAA